MNLAAFTAARLRAQYNTFGKPATIGGLSLSVCASAHVARSSWEEGGLGQELARTVRCRVVDLPSPPKLGTQVTIEGHSYRLAGLTTDKLAGEYVLGLEQRR